MTGDPNEESALDEFTQKRQKIAVKIKGVRAQIKERDEILENNPNSTAAVEASQRCRIEIRELKEDAKELAILQRVAARKALKRKKNEELQDEAAHKQKVVEVVNSHIDECETMERRRYNRDVEKARNEMRGAGSSIQREVVQGEIDEETRVGLQMLAERDAQIDRSLDELSSAVRTLRGIATSIGDELKVQEVRIEETTEKMDRQIDKLDNLNQRLKDTLDKVRGGDKFIIDFIVICLILAGLGVVYKLFAAKAVQDNTASSA